MEITHKMATLSSRILISFILIAAAAATAGGARPQPQPQISEEELLHLVKQGRDITNRTIQGSALIKALRWLQENPDGFGLTVTECTVEGPFSFYEGLGWGDTPRDQNDDLKILLAQTPVSKLPHAIAQHYTDANIDKVIVIPFDITFRSTKFTAAANFSFVETVFEGLVEFNGVDFGEGFVGFDNSTFLSSSEFDTCTFQTEASFAGATFKADTSFVGSKFMNNAIFDGAIFEWVSFGTWVGKQESRFDKSALFRQVSIKKALFFSTVSFGGIVDFADAEIAGEVFFHECKIEGDAFFPDLNRKAAVPTGNLAFSDTKFLERAYFNNANLNELSFFPRTDNSEMPEKWRGATEVASPVVFAKRAKFTGMKCNRADFHEAEFRDYADLSEARFANHLDLSNATFEGGVNFFGARFPANTGTANLLLNGVQFSKGVTVDWSQLGNNLDSVNLDTLRRMEGAFKQLGDLEGQNEVLFRRKHLEGSQSGRWRKLINRAELAFWGYGVRPLRLLGWMFALFVLMTIVYWTQTRSLATRGSRIKNAWRRLTFALAFSLRTSWSLGFGYKNARTRLFQTLTLIHSIAFKILFILLLQAFANTSPLLNQLVGKLIHI